MLVDELPVIENLDVYREIGDVRFLEELQTRGYLVDDPEPDANP